LQSLGETLAEAVAGNVTNAALALGLVAVIENDIGDLLIGQMRVAADLLVPPSGKPFPWSGVQRCKQSPSFVLPGFILHQRL
jgi:hypothetical protein